MDSTVDVKLMYTHVKINNLNSYIIRYAIHDFSVWLRTVSNPADINKFRGHTGK